MIHNPESMMFSALLDEGEGALKGTTSEDKVTNVIEMIRCAYKTDRKVKFKKDTWKLIKKMMS